MSGDILGGKPYLVYPTDCIEAINSMPSASVDFSVYSPPFPSVYSYTSLPEDLGNSEDLRGEVKLHFGFFFKQIIRVLKPGRVMVVHCTQIIRMKRSGGDGVFDFRGLLIRLAERAGFIHDHEWSVRHGPQQQAIRTKSRSLQFAGLRANRAQSRAAMPDYLLRFRVPGETEVPINSDGQVSNNDWIKWAEYCWDDINENDTLNREEARGESDTRHICPMALEIYRRLILMYTNPGEIVFEPFAGIFSGCFMSMGGKSPKTGKFINEPRRYLGCEIKPEYLAAGEINAQRAIKQREFRVKAGAGRSGSILDACEAAGVN